MIALKPARPGPLWRLFSSIWLAVFLMTVILVMSAVGHGLGIKETEEVFFQSWYFSAFLIVLGANITVCTLSRSPWRLSQIPWLMVHLGLLVIIAGGVLTRFRTEGQLYVREGDPAERVMLLADRQVSIERREGEHEEPAHGPGDGHDHRPRVWERDVRLTHLPRTDDLLGRPDVVARVGAISWGLFLLLGTGVAWRICGRRPAVAVACATVVAGVYFQVRTYRAATWEWPVFDGEAVLTFERYLPHHELVPAVEADPTGRSPGAVELEFRHGEGGQVDVVAHALPFQLGQAAALVVPGPDGAPVSLCAPHVESASELERLLAGPTLGAFVVRRETGEELARADVAAVLTGAAPRVLEVAGVRLRLSEAYRNFQLHEDHPIDGAGPDGPIVNPALRIDVVGPDGTPLPDARPRYVFAYYRELNAMQPLPGLALDYELPRCLLPPGPSVSFVTGPGRHEVRLLARGLGATPALVPLGPDFAPIEALPGLEVRVVRVLPSAREVQVPTFVDPAGRRDAKDLPDAVFVRLREGRSEDAGWLPYARPLTLHVAGREYVLLYAAKQHELPFGVLLRDFTIEWAPGEVDRHPLAFRSDVTVHEGGRPRFDYPIYMNHTLVHRGFTLYQSSYIREPGQPDISIFAVQSDPGQYVFYAGALTLCLGVLMIFYVKPWLRQVELRRRGQAPAAAAEAVPAAGPGV